MARIDIKYNYKFGSKNRYYGSGTPRSAFDVGLEAFVVDHLNKSRQQLILDLSNSRRQGERLVRNRSRVDTGRMKSLVTGTGEFGTDILKITFGWETLKPYYAPFNEFGTRHGITPMLAVHDAYQQVWSNLRNRLSR